MGTPPGIASDRLLWGQPGAGGMLQIMQSAGEPGLGGSAFEVVRDRFRVLGEEAAHLGRGPLGVLFFFDLRYNLFQIFLRKTKPY